jgi:hypothetical protein
VVRNSRQTHHRGLSFQEATAGAGEGFPVLCSEAIFITGEDTGVATADESKSLKINAFFDRQIPL